MRAATAKEWAVTKRGAEGGGKVFQWDLVCGAEASDLSSRVRAEDVGFCG